MSSDYASRTRLFRDALRDGLEGLAPAVSVDGLHGLLVPLVRACALKAEEDENARGVLDAFEAIAGRPTVNEAVSEAASLFESPQRFREALFFLRCLDRDAPYALSLSRERAYLSAAIVPASTYPALAAEQATLLDATTFEILWREPESVHDMEASIRAWRRAYAPAYASEHAEYNRHVSGVVSDVEAALWQTEALQKLNRLERLGEPLATNALVQFHALESLYACPSTGDDLATAIEELPVCPLCDFRLGELPPVEALNSALVNIERALATQQTRLARRIVNRILSRPGRPQDDRLHRFIRVVQDSDLSGLARELDEGLLEFLDDVLSTPEPRVNLIDRLAKDFPEVTETSLEAAVEAFRALVQDELQRGGGRVVIGREDGE